MLRHLSHRSSQVRDLVFIRDAIYEKEIATHRKSGTTTALSGPAVNFGYEKSSYATTAGSGTDIDVRDAAKNSAYHINSPQLVLPGLKMLQSPITSRSGKLERLGHRISGACTFFAPSLDYIKSLDNFSETSQFGELESYDKLIDMERIILNPADWSGTSATHRFTFDNAQPGYEIDRIQFKIRTAGTLKEVVLEGNVVDDLNQIAAWNISSPYMSLSSTVWTTIDVPVNKVKDNDTITLWQGGVGSSFNFTADTDWDNYNSTTRMYGDSNNELTALSIELGASAAMEIKDVYLYKEAEWRIDSIKDYRDEYMQIGAVRVRGERASRRRAYG
jgi:hypothetical protein